MLMDLLLDPYAHYNASSLVLVIANLISVIVIVLWMIDMMKYQNVGIRKLLHVRPLRMLLGAAVSFAGVVIGCAMWLPAFPILISGDDELLERYIQFASWPSNFGNMISVIGMTIILWPWLQKKFGQWTYLTLIATTTAVYAAGIVGSLYLGALIAQWNF